MRSIIRFLFVLLFCYADCDHEYVVYTDVNLCYKFHAKEDTWLDAKTTCLIENSELAMPRNENEAKALTDLLQQSTTKKIIFVNSHNYFKSNDYVTTDYNIQNFYHEWDTQQPDGKSKHCLALGTNQKLRNYYCYQKLPFICQKKCTNEKTVEVYGQPPKDPLYVLEQNSGKYFKLHMVMRDWATALAICRAEGGRLAVIESESEENFLSSMFNNHRFLWPLKNEWALIGIHDYFKTRTFYTITDKKVEELGYSRWAKKHPSKASNRCGAINKEGLLGDFNCQTPAQFFCEIKSV